MDTHTLPGSQFYNIAEEEDVEEANNKTICVGKFVEKSCMGSNLRLWKKINCIFYKKYKYIAMNVFKNDYSA